MTCANKHFITANTLWFIISASMTFHVVILLLGESLLSDWQWFEPIAHTALEIAGTIIALFVGMFLLRYNRLGRGTHFNIRIAAAMIAMGIIDGFHAIVAIGDTFVWLHSMATFIGGLLFISIYAPKGWVIFESNRWWQSVVLLSCVLGANAIIFPQTVPAMTSNGKFTDVAVILNQFGGVLFFIAAIKLIFTYQKFKSLDDLLFCLHCFSFGTASIMFEQSTFWDAPWWGWHFLRFIAYAIALLFIVRAESAISDQLFNNFGILEQAVDTRTAQLREANDGLEMMMHNMKQTQAKLVDKEKQTAIAQALTQQSLDELTLAKDSLVQTEKWHI